MAAGQQGFLLEYVFHCLGRFAFDRAKEVCDREKDALKNPQGISAVWTQFLASLSQLAVAEKGYMTLVFLTQTPNNKKAFRNKEVPLRSLYGQIKQDLEKFVETMHGFAEHDVLGTISSPVLAHLCIQLGHFTAARLDMCDMYAEGRWHPLSRKTVNNLFPRYERLHEMGITRQSNFGEVTALVDAVVTTYGKKIHHPSLSTLVTSFAYETEILKHLIDAQMRMGDWSFMPALVHLNHAHRQIGLWPTEVQSGEPVYLSSKLSPARNVALPALYLWFQRYHAALLAKYSLYFYDILSKQVGASSEIRSLLARNVPDYYQRISTFHRKSDASNVWIVLDTNGMEYRGAGYRLPEVQLDVPTGLGSYPVIFSYPSERPAKLLPSVVMHLSREMQSLEDLDAVVPFSDKLRLDEKDGAVQDITYFIARIEERFYMVLVYEMRKSEKDSGVHQFLTDIVAQLRGSKVLESLKPV